jgi:hypothetical protein
MAPYKPAVDIEEIIPLLRAVATATDDDKNKDKVKYRDSGCARMTTCVELRSG